MNTERHGFAAENLELEISGRSAVVRFSRPQIKNPLSVQTLAELKEVFTSLESDSQIETIILTGSGDTFASGADLNEIAALTVETAHEFARRGQRLMQKILHSKKMTIAAIDGYCMGGALDLALSCKMRFASPRSVFAHPGARLGIITGWGGTQMLPRLIGRKKALEILLTARRVKADEALEIRLIDNLTVEPLEKALRYQAELLV